MTLDFFYLTKLIKVICVIIERSHLTGTIILPHYVLKFVIITVCLFNCVC